MAEKRAHNVTMRIRVGESELEVTGPSKFVEKKIAEFIEINKTAPLARPTVASSGPQAPTEQSVMARKAMSPAQFFRKAGARTNVDRTLLAGSYLETSKGLESFTAGEATGIIRDAKIAPPKNTNDLINANIRKGFMMAAGDRDGRRAFVLTSDGEDAVRAMLTE